MPFPPKNKPDMAEGSPAEMAKDKRMGVPEDSPADMASEGYPMAKAKPNPFPSNVHQDHKPSRPPFKSKMGKK